MVSFMLGRDHALLGGLGFLVVAPMILHNPSWQELGVGCVTSAAFALLPDLDEPGSTVSRKLGPLSRSVSRITNVVAGGHRQATHSLFFVALVALATWLALLSSLTVAIVVAASFLLVFRMLLPRALRYVPLVGVGTLVLTAGSAYWAYHLASATAGVAAPSADWLLLATAGGCFLHLCGDALTVEGIPILWTPFVTPLQHFRIAIPLVGHTGSARESLLGSIMGIALLWMAFVLVLTPARHSIVLPTWNFSTINPMAHFHLHLPNLTHFIQQLKARVTPPRSAH
jgi:membrane-bound metal-dependent hydrolase YbcI (DUF457 family)